MGALPRTKVPVCISLPINFLCMFDDHLQKIDRSRSEYVFDAIKEKMERDKRIKLKGV